MFCRLCITDCNDFCELFDGTGHCTQVFNVAVRYFPTQLSEKIESAIKTNSDHKYPRIICQSCWKSIENFHEFFLSVQLAQDNYECFIKFEENIKNEVEIGGDVDTFKVVPKAEEIVEQNPVKIDIFNDQEVNNKTSLSPSLNTNQDDNSECIDNESDSKESVVSISQKNIKKKLKNGQRMFSKGKTKAELHRKISRECGKKKDSLATQDSLEKDNLIAKHIKLSCNICQIALVNFSKLKLHYRLEHQMEGYVICCNKTFSKRGILVEHINVHLDPDHFKCKECGKVMANRRCLVSHMRFSHPAEEKARKTLECDVCHKKFQRTNVLKRHKETHITTGSKDYACKECGKEFILESRLRLHTDNVHNYRYEKVCDICGKSVRGKKALQTHLLEHEGIKPKWPCLQCDAQLNSKYSLARHVKLSHHDRSTIYVCNECGKVAHTESALLKHKQYVHNTERKFKCNICEKAFKMAITLREHMSTHTGQNLYKCPHCPQTFKVSSNMHHHRKKAHPKEFEEKRQRRLLATNINMELVEKKIHL